MTRMLVHVGPTLPATEILRMAPDAEIQPPVEGWMVGRTRPRAGDVVVLIDGYYRDRPAVRHKEIMHLIEAHGISEGEQGPALRHEAYSFARARLEAHRSKVVTLAELLVEHGRMEATEVMLLMRTIG